MIIVIPVSVNKTFLWRREHIDMLAFRPPNQGLESSFCRWTARQGLAQKECLFTDTGKGYELSTKDIQIMADELRKAQLTVTACLLRTTQSACLCMRSVTSANQSGGG